MWPPSPPAFAAPLPCACRTAPPSHAVVTHRVPSLTARRARRAHVPLRRSILFMKSFQTPDFEESSSTGHDDTDNDPSTDATESLSHEESECLESLRDDGSTRQVLALLSLPGLPVARAQILLRSSGVLNSSFRKTRISVLDVLGKLGDSSMEHILSSTLRDDGDHSVRAAAAGALSNMPVVSAGGTGVLRAAAINDEHFIVRYSAIVALGNIADMAAVSLFVALVAARTSPPLEVAAAVDALGEILDAMDVTESCLQTVRSREDDDDDLIRAAVARTLGRWKSRSDARAALMGMLAKEVRRGHSSFVHALIEDLMRGTDTEQ